MHANPKWSSDDVTLAVLDACPTPVFVKDAQRRFVLVNSAGAALMGRSIADIVGRTDADFFPESIARRHWSEDDAVLGTGAPFSGEEAIEGLAAGPSLILVRKTRAFDSAGRALVVCTVTDLTALRAAELTTRDANARSAEADSILRSVLDSGDSAIFSIDRRYRYTSFNLAHAAAMRQLYGVEIALGGCLADYQWSSDWEIARRNLDRTLAGESFMEQAFSGLEARSRRFFEISHHPVREVHGLITGAAVFSRDITERHTAAEALRSREEELRQAQKMEVIGRLAGGIAHDFNNLLSVISSSVSFLRDAVPREGPVAEDLAEISGAAQRAKALTSQLLGFSRRQLTHPVVFDVNPRIRDLGRLLQRIIGEDIKLTLDLSPLPSLVSADPSSLDQVLMNLIVNARDAMPEGGSLVIRTAAAVLREGKVTPSTTQAAKTHVLVKVSDSGHGMTPDVRARLFEPFFTTKEESRGTGLGLAIVAGAIQRAGGTIEVSSAPGQGSIFTVYFPIPTAEQAEASDGADLEIPRARPGESVLVVEDDEQVLRSATRTLRRLGYAVFSAANLEQAAERAKFAPSGVSVLLTDVVLPGGGGLAVSRAIEEAIPGTPVIFMSGFPAEVILGHGVSGRTLQKPFAPESLGRAVRMALDAERLRRAGAPAASG